MGEGAWTRLVTEMATPVSGEGALECVRALMDSATRQCQYAEIGERQHRQDANTEQPREIFLGARQQQKRIR